MTLYDFVKATLAEYEPPATDVFRIVSTLRAAGYPETLVERNLGSARDVVVRSWETRQAAAEAAKPAMKTASPADVDPRASAARFEEIGSLIGQKLCPRCKKSTKVVKLSNYRPTQYCQMCKVALWPVA